MTRKQRKWSMKSVPKDTRKYIRMAVSKGWTPRIAGSCHTVLLPPEGDTHSHITVSMSPSDHRARKSMIIDFRRAGILEEGES